MKHSDYLFISGVASFIHTYSQFPLEVCSWIGCQFALESSYGTSRLAIDNNNYCGMRNPLVRISSALHAGDPNFSWALYDDLESCCVDYLLCVQYHRPISDVYDTVCHFSRFIAQFYCPDKDYIDKINSIYFQFQNYLNNGKN